MLLPTEWLAVANHSRVHARTTEASASTGQPGYPCVADHGQEVKSSDSQRPAGHSPRRFSSGGIEEPLPVTGHFGRGKHSRVAEQDKEEEAHPERPGSEAEGRASRMRQASSGGGSPSEVHGSTGIGDFERIGKWRRGVEWQQHIRRREREKRKAKRKCTSVEDQ